MIRSESVENECRYILQSRLIYTMKAILEAKVEENTEVIYFSSSYPTSGLSIEIFKISNTAAAIGFPCDTPLNRSKGR